MRSMSSSEDGFLRADIRFMKLALKEARKGIGRTSPNPCVGAVIVQDGTVISSGYHKKAGSPHAEINALAKAGVQARGATIYVTLEPCNHTGKTPPCSHAVAAAGIKRVVVGMKDPNPLVNGSGNTYLMENGIEVLTGVLEEECVELNRAFSKYITTGRPLVVMKAGISLDGKLSYQEGKPGKMTGEQSHHKVHLLRNRHDAILVGSGTVTADNPSLTTRLGRNGRDPLRVILDSSLSLSLESKILHLESDAETLIFCSTSVDSKHIALFAALDGVRVQPVSKSSDHHLDLNKILEYLGGMGVCSLLVEGGGAIHSAFLREGLVDRVILFIAPLFAGTCGTGLLADFPVEGRAKAPKLTGVTYRRCGDDMIVQGNLS